MMSDVIKIRFQMELELSPGLHLSQYLKSSNLQNPSAQTPTPPPYYLINFPFSSVMQGSFEIHRGCILLFLHSIALKKTQPNFVYIFCETPEG